jgi:hypothetical protein
VLGGEAGAIEALLSSATPFIAATAAADLGRLDLDVEVKAPTLIVPAVGFASISLDLVCSEAQLQGFRDLLAGNANPVPPNKVKEVVYLLQEMHSDMVGGGGDACVCACVPVCRSMLGSGGGGVLMRFLPHAPLCRTGQSLALLVLAAFAGTHEEIVLEVIELLVAQVSQPITAGSERVLQSAILGLRHLASTSQDAFKTILSSLLSIPAVNEGDVLCLLHLVDIVKDLGEAKVPEMLVRFAPMYAQARYTPMLRNLALFLSGELPCGCLCRCYCWLEVQGMPGN